MLICSSLDTMITPLTDRFFGFTDLQNGYLLLVCGVLSFVSYTFMQLPQLNPPEYKLVIIGILANAFVIIGE